MTAHLLECWRDLIIVAQCLESDSDFCHFFPYGILPIRISIFLVDLNTIFVSLWNFNSQLLCPSVVKFVNGCDTSVSTLESKRYLPGEGRFVLKAVGHSIIGDFHYVRFFQIRKALPGSTSVVPFKAQAPTLSGFTWLQIGPVFDIHTFLFNGRAFLSVVNDPSKKQVLVALTVALGKHILRDYIRRKLSSLPIRKFYFMRARIENWVGVGFALKCSVGFTLPSADLGIHYYVPYWEYNFGTHVLIISFGVSLVVVISGHRYLVPFVILIRFKQWGA